MARLTFKLLVLAVVATVLLQMSVPALGAGPAYTPGVLPGQWVKYGQISATWTSNIPMLPVFTPISDLLAVSSMRVTVQNVQGHNVTAGRIRSYNNGTVASDILSGSVETEAGNLSLWVVAGGLAPHESIYTTVPQLYFNSTISRQYLGETRSVNEINATQVSSYLGEQATVKIRSFWDHASGVLLELHFTFNVQSGSVALASGSADAMIVDGNIFGVALTPDFALYPSPVPIVVAPGAKGSTSVVPVSLNNFTGTVNLSVTFLGSNQVVASVAPTSVAVSPTGSGSATLTVAVGASVTPGYYSVNLTGTTGNLSHYFLVAVQIIGSAGGPGFYLSAYPTFLPIVQGSKGSALVSVASTSFTGTVFLSTGFIPLSLTARLTTYMLSLAPGLTNSSTLSVSAASSASPGLYSLNVTGSASTGHSSTMITLQVTPSGISGYTPGVHEGDWVYYGIVRTRWQSNLPITKPSFIANYGNVTDARLNVTTTNGADVMSGLTWTFPNATAARTIPLIGDVDSGSGNLRPWIIAGSLGPGDPIYNSQFAPKINSTVTRAYAGSLRTLNVLNLTYTFSSVPGARGGDVWYWDKASGALMEQYLYLNVSYSGYIAVGYSDIIATQAKVTSLTPDFTISANPPIVALGSGGSATSTITLTSINGFSGNVTLFSNDFSYICLALFCPHLILAPSPVSLTSGGTATSTLTFTAIPLGTYDITVNATSAGVMHSVTVEFTVNALPPPDFSLTGTSSLSIQAGKSGIATFDISLVNGFTSQVNLTATAPSGMTVQLFPNSIKSYGTVSLTIAVSTSLAPGTYTVTVKAVGGSQIHTRTISVTVTTPPPASAASNLILGLDPTLFYGIIGTVAAIAIVGGILVVRMRKLPIPPPQAPSGTASVQA